MSRKFIAVSLITLWLVVLGVDFLDDINPANYSRFHHSVRTTLISLLQAVKMSDDEGERVSHKVSIQLRAFYPLLIQTASLQSVREEEKSSKKDFKIYKSNRVFLI